MLVPCSLRHAGTSLVASLCAPTYAFDQPMKLPALLDGWLSNKDPFDTVLKQSRAKVYEVELEKGVHYLVELRSDDFDTHLRVEDNKGKVLAENQKLYQGASG